MLTRIIESAAVAVLALNIPVWEMNMVQTVCAGLVIGVATYLYLWNRYEVIE